MSVKVCVCVYLCVCGSVYVCVCVRVCLRELLLASQASQLGADQKCKIKSQLYYRHMQ